MGSVAGSAHHGGSGEGRRDVETSTTNADGGHEPVSRRVVAMLRAVASGRAEVSCSCEPDLYVDGLGCCDQYTAHRLASGGLVRPTVAGTIGQRVRAELTPAGQAVLATLSVSVRAG